MELLMGSQDFFSCCYYYVVHGRRLRINNFHDSCCNCGMAADRIFAMRTPSSSPAVQHTILFSAHWTRTHLYSWMHFYIHRYTCSKLIVRYIII